jgi:hypothetical protein
MEVMILLMIMLVAVPRMRMRMTMCMRCGNSSDTGVEQNGRNKSRAKQWKAYPKEIRG